MHALLHDIILTFQDRRVRCFCPSAALVADSRAFKLVKSHASFRLPHTSMMWCKTYTCVTERVILSVCYNCITTLWLPSTIIPLASLRLLGMCRIPSPWQPGCHSIRLRICLLQNRHSHCCTLSGIWQDPILVCCQGGRRSTQRTFKWMYRNRVGRLQVQ